MTYSIVVGGDKWTEVATTLGLADAEAFVNGLAVEEYHETLHLFEHGWSQNLESLAEELSTAGEDATEDVRSVLDAIKSAVDGRDDDDASAILTDGLTAEEDEGGEWEFTEEEEE